MNKKEAKNILITGGAGFIGSHVVRRFVKNYSNYHIYNLDALTYQSALEGNVKVDDVFEDYKPETVFMPSYLFFLFFI